MERKEEGPSRKRRSASGQSAGERGSVEGDVGNALRTVFEQTISEDIPSEMLDLLKKLA